jgi:hypothetical protein
MSSSSSSSQMSGFMGRTVEMSDGGNGVQLLELHGSHWEITGDECRTPVEMVVVIN